jgi:hypothetical protein
MAIKIKVNLKTPNNMFPIVANILSVCVLTMAHPHPQPHLPLRNATSQYPTLHGHL